jgi:hypothetical protein
VADAATFDVEGVECFVFERGLSILDVAIGDWPPSAR